MSAGDTRFDKCDDILMHLGPEVVAVEELKCFHLSRVARERMVVTGFEYAHPKVSASWDIDYAFMEEEHSMDGVLFHVCSLNGLWLIHDNYPSSIPLFYIMWDTLRNLT